MEFQVPVSMCAMRYFVEKYSQYTEQKKPLESALDFFA